MKYMITGGNTGLGLVLRQYFGADSYSRGNGYDIVDQRDIIADLSLNYDVFINNAYDGEFWNKSNCLWTGAVAHRSGHGLAGKSKVGSYHQHRRGRQ
jgi:hypothetical protein